ncbi:HD domain-containing protein [Desulfoluna sp.]|uniref:HD domain-containing protein n=1 Tax=Desulfoluna sp. TaxID=2045199 RepID=UPI002622E2A8|nr:HD domain-containing protein [Desulfoluna sp.]
MIEHACEVFLKGRSVQDGAHDLGHVKRVVALARRIGEAEGANLSVVVPAAWLHDCVSVAKDSPDRPLASRFAAEEAVGFLKGLGYPAGRLDAVYHAIESHSFSLGKVPETLEAQVVQDADRLDAIGALGIARCFLTGGAMGSALFHPEDPFGRGRTLDDRAYAVDHFYLKLLTLKESLHTDAARREAGRRHDFMCDFLEELKREVTHGG